MTRIRQLRLSDPDLIRKRIPEFTGKKINIVLKDDRVIVGELKQTDDKGLSLMNMRQKVMRFTFPEINEIYFDTTIA